MPKALQPTERAGITGHDANTKQGFGIDTLLDHGLCVTAHSAAGDGLEYRICV